MTTRNPVLLIHGIDDTGAVFRKMAVVLEGQGWLTHALDLVPNNGQVGLDRLAEQIQGYIERTFSQDTRFDIVAFSMGGIISRYYLQRLGGLERCDRFITLSSPHHGSLMSYVRQNPGCVQMRPNSQFLQDLNRDFDQLNSVQFTSIWTPNDLMILPAKSSNVPVGKNITVPVLIHPWMLTDDRIIELVGQYLKKTGVG
ncbi:MULTISPECIES: alpha/beta fold hydrolase [unclassified Roseofilum]|uniref:alpha/beta fold hydrolase n=1 Tax=unclassified Roseofilum TaxID=2620099 RepID=UPI000E883768|nr:MULTISPECIES: alpha/beta fold hydrolase [unclassified Roseofilum]MBP0010979.1 alpha/beta fold hydrolase [Roseofilum sp. Belize Diploria]MBP0035124.1 alpha/beta fold hydrolase [Roseofilum sp. Belize BBD 4]HBQ99178.1 lipase [Cyanobacteria bacterium UBA11691]